MSQLRTFCALAAASAACRLLRRTLRAAGGGVAPVKNGIVAVLSACAVVAVVAVQSIAFTPDARAQTSNPCSAGQGVFPNGQCHTCPPAYENSATLTADGFCTCPEGEDLIATILVWICVPQNIADAFKQCESSGYSTSYGVTEQPNWNYCEVPIRNVGQSQNNDRCYLDDSADTVSPHCTAVFGPDLVIPQKPTDGSAPRYVFNCDPDGDNEMIPATINTIGATECACSAGKGIQNGVCVAASAEVCGGLTPAQFYDAAAGACVPYVTCVSPEVLYPEANDCHAASDYPLHDAVFAGDLDLVNHFITFHMREANVNAERGSSWVTPLHLAARDGHAAIAAALIAASANVSATNREGFAPLHLAAGGEHAAIVSLLIAAKANVNARSGAGSRPLHFAVNRGNAAIVSLLIAATASVNVKSAAGETPLYSAVYNGYSGIVADLIDAGADVKQTVYADGNTPLHWAVFNGRNGVGVYRGGDVDIVAALLAAGATVNVKNSNDRTPLARAAFYNITVVYPALIAAGAYWGEAACGIGLVTNPAGPAPPCVCEPPNVGTPGNCVAPNAERCGLLTPAQFYDAAAGACVLFVTCGPGEVVYKDVNDCHAAGDYPLYDAVFAGDLELVNHFITVHMEDLEERRFDNTPLHIAAIEGHASIVAALIAATANVNARNSRTGATPLHHAADFGHAAVVSLLVQATASLKCEKRRQRHAVALGRRRRPCRDCRLAD